MATSNCLTDEALSHLKTYKYSSVDKSPVSKYILRHYWNWAVEYLPLWMAPNMVTLVGFLFILGNVGLCSIMIPDLVGPAPSWVYFSFAIGVWMYSTMDNIDGKQARRTGTSSGLGELFDHGIDSLNCTLASLLETAALGFGATKVGAFTAMIPTLPMFFSTWETYHSHTLYLGYFNGPTEGLIIASLMMIISGIWGPQVWSLPFAELFPILSPFVSPTTNLVDIWFPFVLGAFLIGHLPPCIKHVWEARSARGQPMAPLFLEWTPMIAFTAASSLWICSPYSWILKDNHLTLFCLTMSMVFGRMTTKIILAHLTRQPFPYWTVLITPLVVGAVLTNLPYLGFSQILTAQTELYYLWAYFVIATVIYGRWAYVVINAICDFLGINALTIPKEKWKLLIQAQQQGNGHANGPLLTGQLSAPPKKD